MKTTLGNLFFKWRSYTLFILTVIILPLLQVGCTSKYSYLQDDPLNIKLYLDAKINNFSIRDKRKETTTRILKIPFIGLPGRSDQIQPLLSPDHLNIIRSEFDSYFIGSEKTYNIDVRITEGVQKYEAAFFSEKEYVKFALEVDLIEAASNTIAFNGYGEAYYEVKSMDASNEFINKLYEKAIKTCIYEFCKKIKIKTIQNTI